MQVKTERLYALKGSPLALKSMTETEQLQIIDELLARREVAGATDTEVEGLHGVVQYFLTNSYLEGEDIDDRTTAQMGNDKLRAIAIARGQQLQELVGLLTWLATRKYGAVDVRALLAHAAKFKEPYPVRILQIVEQVAQDSPRPMSAELRDVLEQTEATCRRALATLQELEGGDRVQDTEEPPIVGNET